MWSGVMPGSPVPKDVPDTKEEEELLPFPKAGQHMCWLQFLSVQKKKNPTN